MTGSVDRAAGAKTRRGSWRSRIAAVAAGLLVVALRFAIAERPVRASWTDDERDYLAAATNLARFGTLAFAAEGETPRPSAYREPAYPALLAAIIRVSGEAPPPEALLSGPAGPDGARMLAIARRGNAALLAIAAVAAGLVVAELEGGALAAMAAAALVAASPALGARAELVASEPLAAALSVLFAWASARWVRAGGARRAVVAGLLGAALALARAVFALVVPVVFVVDLLVAARERRGARLGREAIAFGLAALVPIASWMVRNRVECGHWVVADRGGFQLLVRAELDDALARGSYIGGALEWTPLEAARSFARERGLANGLDEPRWKEGQHYFVRAVDRWGELRSRLVDPLAADAAARREAFARIAAHPVHHLAATPVVAWRSVFAEGSPELVAPIDLRLPLGLLLAAGSLVFLVLAALRRSWIAFAVGAPAAALFIAHSLLSEGLPRYEEPALPLLWAILVAVLAERLRRGRTGVSRRS